MQTQNTFPANPMRIFHISDRILVAVRKSTAFHAKFIYNAFIEKTNLYLIVKEVKEMCKDNMKAMDGILGEKLVNEILAYEIPVNVLKQIDKK